VSAHGGMFWMDCTSRWPEPTSGPPANGSPGQLQTDEKKLMIIGFQKRGANGIKIWVVAEALGR
jgi:hypothetical protein